MNKNKKVILSLGAISTVLLSTVAVVSCKKTQSEQQKVIDFVNANIIDKDLARWTKPSDASSNININNKPISKFIDTKQSFTYSITQEQLLIPSIIKGFTLSEIQILDPGNNNEKGFVYVNYKLTRGEEKITVKNQKIDGFLTNSQEKINTEFENILKELKITNGVIELDLKSDVADKKIEDNKNKNLNELLEKVEDSDIKTKLQNLLKSDSGDKLKAENIGIYTFLDVETPVISFDSYIINEKNESSRFLIHINGFEKKLHENDVKNLVNLGILLKSEAHLVFPSVININNYTNWIKTGFEEVNNPIEEMGYTDGSNKISFEIKEIKSFDNAKGSLTVNMTVKLDKNSNESFDFITTLYGFLITK